MKSLLILILSICIISGVYSQERYYRFDHINTDNGLSKNYVNDIFQDSNGFIWFATTNGLNKFDGTNIKIYYHAVKDTTSISSNIINCIFEDSEKTLWIGTEFGGLAKYNLETDNFTSFRFQKTTKYDPEDDVVSSIAQIDSTHLLLGTPSGLLLFNKGNNTYERFLHTPQVANSLNSNDVSIIIVDSRKRVWLGSSTNENLCTFNPKNKTFFTYQNPKSNLNMGIFGINTLCEDADGKIWMGSIENGLSVFNPATEEYESIDNEIKKFNFVGLERIREIYCDNQKNIWIGSKNNGIFKINKSTKEIENISPNELHKFGLSSPSITSCFEDNKHNMWFATKGGGINILKKMKNNFEYYTRTNDQQSLSNNYVTCFYEDASANVWIGTDGGSLNKFNTKTRTFDKFNYKNGLSANIILDIKQSEDNNIWLATLDEGLILMNLKGVVLKTFMNSKNPNSLSFNQIKQIEIINNEIHIATNGDGINLYDYKNNMFYNHINSPDLKKVLYPQLFCNDIIFHKDKIWYATTRGIFVKSDNTLRNYAHIPSDTNSLSNNNVITIFRDSKENLWFGTKNGLNLYNEDSDNFTNINLLSELPSEIKAILEDKEGNLWISTDDGIIKLDPVSLNTSHFTITDGLQGNDFNERACMLAHDGKMYFGGINGFSAFYPDSIMVLNNDIVPYLSELYVQNQLIRPNDESKILTKQLMFCDEIELPYNKSSFTISFNSLDLINAHRLKYAYWMENLEEDWNYVKYENSAHFTSLKPGTYYFHIKSSTGNIFQSNAIRTLKIIITPPFWATLWFKILAFITITLIIYISIQQRLKRIVEQRKVLEFQVKERTKEIEIQKNILADQTEMLQEQNITLREQQEELTATYSELKIQSDELQSANSELRKINETKDKLFSLIAHDLKGPVGSIQSFSELISNDFDELETQEIKDYINIILDSSRVTVEMFENLLEWARSQTEVVHFEPITLNLKEIVHSVIDFQSLTASNKNIQIVNKIRKDIWLYADKNMLLSVFRNLISNSIKFTHEGGAITINAEQINNEIFISVKDNGIGMTTKRIQAILNKEDQLPFEGTEGERGVGLGLTISKEFIEHHGGKILIESALSKGTTIIVSLPVLTNKITTGIEENQQKGLNAETNSDNESHGFFDSNILNDKIILLIDDNPNTRQAIKYNFKNKCEIIEAKDGQQGIELARQKMPDLIISDILMPEKNGIDLCRALKNDNHTNFIPIILLTASDSDFHKREGYSAGADEYIVKPFNPEILESRIINLLQKQENIKKKIRENLLFELEDSFDDNPNTQFILKVKEVTDQHLTDTDFSVEFLASQLGYSRYQFFRKFKAVIGQTPIEYILNYRLQKAEQLLRRGELRVSEIAYETGFSNPKYFATTFKKKYDMSPSEYMDKKISS